MIKRCAKYYILNFEWFNSFWILKWNCFVYSPFTSNYKWITDVPESLKISFPFWTCNVQSLYINVENCGAVQCITCVLHFLQSFILYFMIEMCFVFHNNCYYYYEMDRKHIAWKCSNVQSSGTREDNWFIEIGKWNAKWQLHFKNYLQ